MDGGWEPGAAALEAFAQGVTKIIDFTKAGTAFVFGPLADVEKNGFVFAIQVLPVIVFFGTLVDLLYTTCAFCSGSSRSSAPG